MTKEIYEIGRKSNYVYRKASRWIKVEYTIISPRNRLADYADKDDGEHLNLTCFRFKGKQYALGQFMQLAYPIMLEDGSIISGYDATQSYRPLMIVIHTNGEAVRLWSEEKILDE